MTIQLDPRNTRKQPGVKRVPKFLQATGNVRKSLPGEPSCCTDRRDGRDVLGTWT
jgi:hypothetical protein